MGFADGVVVMDLPGCVAGWRVVDVDRAVHDAANHRPVWAIGQHLLSFSADPVAGLVEVTWTRAGDRVASFVLGLHDQPLRRLGSPVAVD